MKSIPVSSLLTPISFYFDLISDRGVGDFSVRRQQHRLAHDDRQERIARERKKHLDADGNGHAKAGHDAQIFVVGRHEDIAAAEVNFVGAQVAADDEEAVLKRAAVPYLKTRDDVFRFLVRGQHRLLIRHHEFEEVGVLQAYIVEEPPVLENVPAERRTEAAVPANSCASVPSAEGRS